MCPKSTVPAHLHNLLCCSEDSLLFMLEQGSGKLKEDVVLAVDCPACNFLTAFTLHEYSEVSLPMNGISGSCLRDL